MTVPATAKGEATRAYLLRTAARMFAEHGYAGTTQSDLIAASGLTKGAFYFYFKSKLDLALAVVAEQEGRWLAHITERVLAEPTALAQLRAVVPALLDLFAAAPDAWVVMRLCKEFAANPDLPEISKPMASWVTLVADIIRRGQAEGDLREDVDPEAVAEVLVAAFDGLKSLADVLDYANDPDRFASRATTLMTLAEHALLR
ncbi:Transcriptional regulator, TetR family [Alloactinosynnema sp. L-07]|uniref:TetR family transcriptional regulator n=1 Tax=Alloactinosynnema sp. L-07 TaxID=1653480 RepID=UPI00065F003D|nr:TetR family transcriptional regulator [Alloactinosynnema sp. L-07]CRK57158.1 Transcriptional regulator, TetR family [Alloactinosynnema sp. L-07]